MYLQKYKDQHQNPQNVSLHMFYLQKNGQMSLQNSTEQIKTAQYSKSDCFLGTFLVIQHV